MGSSPVLKAKGVDMVPPLFLLCTFSRQPGAGEWQYTVSRVHAEHGTLALRRRRAWPAARRWCRVAAYRNLMIRDAMRRLLVLLALVLVGCSEADAVRVGER